MMLKRKQVPVFQGPGMTMSACDAVHACSWLLFAKLSCVWMSVSTDCQYVSVESALLASGLVMSSACGKGTCGLSLSS